MVYPSYKSTRTSRTRYVQRRAHRLEHQKNTHTPEVQTKFLTSRVSLCHTAQKATVDKTLLSRTKQSVFFFFRVHTIILFFSSGPLCSCQDKTTSRQERGTQRRLIVQSWCLNVRAMLVICECTRHCVVIPSCFVNVYSVERAIFIASRGANGIGVHKCIRFPCANPIASSFASPLVACSERFPNRHAPQIIRLFEVVFTPEVREGQVKTAADMCQFF